MGLFDRIIRGKGWTLNQTTGQLTIRGFIDERAPFRNITDKVRSVTALPGARIINGEYMFQDMKDLVSADLAHLDVSWCVTTNFMFAGCSSLISLDLSAWELKRLRGAKAMFESCISLEEIKMGPGWKLEKLEHASRMFCNCYNLLALDTVEAMKVTDSLIECDSMFGACESLQSLDLNSWDMGSVTSMKRMFAGCTGIKTLDLESWVFEKEVDATDAFDRMKRPAEILCDCLDLLPAIYQAQDSNWMGWQILFNEYTLVIDGWLLNWDQGDERGLPPWYRYADYIKHVVCKHGAMAKTCSNMFYGCVLLEEADLTNLDTTDVTSFDGMFHFCVSLKYADLNTLNTSNVRSMRRVFSECENLSAAWVYKWDVSAVEVFSGFFDNCKSLQEVNLIDWKIGSSARLDNFFAGCKTLTSIYCTDLLSEGLLWDAYDQCAAQDKDLFMHGVQLGNGAWMFDRSAGELVINGTVGDTDYMFSSFARAVRRIRAEKGARVIDGNMLFAHMKNLTEADLAQLDVSQCTNMKAMFEGCESLASLDLTTWDVSKVETMEGMFYSCSSLESIYTGRLWHPVKVRNTSSMFAGCNALREIDIADWQDLYLKHCSNMFAECTELEHLDLGSMYVSQVEDFSSMFFLCINMKTLKLGGWKVSEAEDFSDLFSDCVQLQSLDLTGWHINEKAVTEGMFDSVPATVKVLTEDETIRRLLPGR